MWDRLGAGGAGGGASGVPMSDSARLEGTEDADHTTIIAVRSSLTSE